MKKLKWPGVNKAILNIKIDFSFDEVAVIDTTWEGYLDGYRNAAEILSDLIEKKDHDLAKKDLIAIPLVFLIRHSIELNLKLIIAFCKEKRLFLNDFDFTHNLLESWKTCKRIIELYFDSAPSNDIKNIEKGIKVFNYIDPHSYSLRYPIDVSLIHI